MQERPLLEVRNLTLQYKTQQHLVTATRNVNFTANKGERLILLGQSGCGKSSILKAIGGFIQPASGSILLNGRPIEKPGIDRAFVFQEFEQLLPWKTALENIVFAIQATRKLDRPSAIEQGRHLLRKVNLGRFENSYPNALSGGMKMRVAIARCLAIGAEVVLMDEPFAALDAMTRQKMQDDLMALWGDLGFTLLFVTHSIDEAITLGSKVVVLSSHPGTVVEEMIVRPGERGEAAILLKDRISDIVFRETSDHASEE